MKATSEKFFTKLKNESFVNILVLPDHLEKKMDKKRKLNRYFFQKKCQREYMSKFNTGTELRQITKTNRKN